MIMGSRVDIAWKFISDSLLLHCYDMFHESSRPKECINYVYSYVHCFSITYYGNIDVTLMKTQCDIYVMTVLFIDVTSMKPLCHIHV